MSLGMLGNDVLYTVKYVLSSKTVESNSLLYLPHLRPIYIKSQLHEGMEHKLHVTVVPASTFVMG